MAKNVVPLRRPRSFTRAEDVIDEVRNTIFASGEKYKELAARVGVSPATIHNLASGKTRWPRPTTLFPLLEKLGKELRVVDKQSPGHKP